MAMHINQCLRYFHLEQSGGPTDIAISTGMLLEWLTMENKMSDSFVLENSEQVLSFSDDTTPSFLPPPLQDSGIN